MKSIFTYPNNPLTHYIDPDYYGTLSADGGGWLQRIADASNGTYLPLLGTQATQTIQDISEKCSKFSNASILEELSGQNSLYKFWEQPIITANIEKINNTILSAVPGVFPTQPGQINFGVNHGLYNGQLVELNDFDGTFSAINGNEYYVVKMGPTSIQLSTDPSGTPRVGFTVLAHGDITLGTATIESVFTAAGHTLSDGDPVDLTGLNNDMAVFNDGSYYVQQSTATTFKLSRDAAGTDIIGLAPAGTNFDIVDYELRDIRYPYVSGDNAAKILMTVDPAFSKVPNGTRIQPQFAVPEWNLGLDLSTVLFYYAQGPGPVGEVYVKYVSTESKGKVYELHKNQACTDPLDWKLDIDFGTTTYAHSRRDIAKTIDFQLIKPGEYNNTTGHWSITFSVGSPNFNNITGAAIYDVRSSSVDRIYPSGFGRSDQFFGFAKLWRTTGSNFYYGIYNSDGREFGEYPTYREPINVNEKVISAKYVTIVDRNWEADLTDYSQNDLFIPSLFDDAGNILNPQNSVFMDTTYQPTWNTPEWSTYIATNSFSNLKSSYYNLRPPVGVVYSTLQLATDTFKGVPIIQRIGYTPPATGTSDSGDQCIDISKTRLAQQTQYKVEVTEAVNNQNTTTDLYTIDNTSALHTELLSRYQADTSLVINCPYVMFSSYETGGVETDTALKQCFIIVGYDSTANVFTFKPYSLKINGAPNVSIGWSTGPFDHPGDTLYMTTRLQNPNNVPVPDISTQSINADYYGEWTAAEAGETQSTASYVYMPNTDIHAGEIVDISIIRDSDSVLVATITNVVAYRGGMPSGDQPENPTETGDLIWFGRNDTITGQWENLLTGPGVDLNLELYDQTTHTLSVSHNRVKAWTKSNEEVRFMWSSGEEYIEGQDRNVLHMFYTPSFGPISGDVVWDRSLGATSGRYFTANLAGSATDNLGMNVFINTSDADVLAYNYVDATSGLARLNNYVPVGPEEIVVNDQISSSTGNVGNDNFRLSAPPNAPYLRGNIPFLQRTGASTYVGNAEIDPTRAWGPYDSTAAEWLNTPAGTSITTDASGYINGSSFWDSEFPGEIDLSKSPVFGEFGLDEVLFGIRSVPDTYTPPVLTPLEIAENWRNNIAGNEWNTNGENPLKVWPSHVTPSAASIVYNTPTIVNKSNNGIKYTRTSAFTKWVLEVEYPPMKADDFKAFAAVAQAAHGQSTPFYFPLTNKDGNRIVFRDFYNGQSSSAVPRIRLQGATSIPVGQKRLDLDGFGSNDIHAFEKGEVFTASANENGNLHTSISDATSNVFGEISINLPQPLRTELTQATVINKDPEFAVVTLNSDQFEYSIDVNNYYVVTVAFDLDNWG
jgi:hypothetical protein